MFLRKKAVAAKSIDKVRRIVMESTFLRNLFFEEERKECNLHNIENMEKMEDEPGHQSTIIPSDNT